MDKTCRHEEKALARNQSSNFDTEAVHTIMIEANPPYHSPAKFLFAHFDPSTSNECTFHTPYSDPRACVRL